MILGRANVHRSESRGLWSYLERVSHWVSLLRCGSSVLCCSRLDLWMEGYCSTIIILIIKQCSAGFHNGSLVCEEGHVGLILLN